MPTFFLPPRRQDLLAKIFFHPPFIHVEGLGKIGMYDKMDHYIMLDNGLKFLGLPVDHIYCKEEEIPDKIADLFYDHGQHW